MEAKQKPSVVVVTEEFARLAHQVAAHHGHPSLRVLVLPYPLEGLEHDRLVEIAAESYPELVNALGVAD